MGMPVMPVRDRIVAEGITINGLPIMLKTSYAFGPYSIPNLDVYYEDCVIGGPGAFMITVDDPARFADRHPAEAGARDRRAHARAAADEGRRGHAGAAGRLPDRREAARPLDLRRPDA